jgi:hypothetical protein
MSPMKYLHWYSRKARLSTSVPVRDKFLGFLRGAYSEQGCWSTSTARISLFGE